MPVIYEGVENGILQDRPDLRPVLVGLTGDFDITWGSSSRLYGSNVVYFIVKPKKHMAEAFGLDGELLLIYYQYAELQARVFHIVEKLMNESPIAGRVEPLLFLLVTTGSGFETQVQRLMSNQSQARIIVPMSDAECRGNTDAYLVRNRFSKYLFSRDLFDVSNPIDSDVYFFGRHKFIIEMRDALRSGENIGLFGLRKVGKTSILLRLKRLMETEKSGKVVRIDLENQEFYRMRWWELLQEVAKRLGCKTSEAYTEETAAQKFRQAVEKLKVGGPRKHFVVAFDEIEHICPGEALRMHAHWDRDFIEFWKTVRSIQNVNKHICFIVCGVNASPIEMPVYFGRDNPLFSLASRKYVPMFDEVEVRQMVRTLGRFMGIQFQEDCFSYLTEAYGGHPLIIRQACSAYFRKRRSESRPIVASSEDLTNSEVERNVQLFPYVEHVLGVLTQWYKEEYDLLSKLADGDLQTFQEFETAIPDSAAHLRSYGLVAGQPPKLAMRFIGDYFAKVRLQTILGGTSQDTAPGAESDRLTQISVFRNRLEPRLRAVIKSTFQAKFGPARWIDPILLAIPEKRRSDLLGVDRNEILNRRLYLLDLLQILQKYWSDFSSFEKLPGQLRLTKGGIEVLLDFVNKHREDAHAGEIDDADWVTFLAVATVLDKVLAEYD